MSLWVLRPDLTRPDGWLWPVDSDRPLQYGAPEIIFTTYTSGLPGQPDRPAHLVILNQNGVELHKTEIPDRGSMAAPTIADIDDNGTLEIIISLKDALGEGVGGVQIWDLPGSSTNCLLWETGRGDWLRQGYVPAG